VKRLLERTFLLKECCPIIENNKVQHEYLKGNYAKYRGFDFYAGHYGYDIFCAVNNGHQPITNFRHPVSRIISLYNFFRFEVVLSDEDLMRDEYYAVNFAKTRDFSMFISTADPRVAVYVENAHLRQLAGSLWEIGGAQRSFSEVCRFIDEMPWYYICEHAELSYIWMTRLLKRELEPMPRENVTNNHFDKRVDIASVGQNVQLAILRRNKFDLEIFNHAIRRIHSTVAR
jgi:hypothetical protein